MIDQLNQVLGELTRLHANADRLLDSYIEHVQRRDDLGGQPLPSLRQCHIDGRAGLALNLRRALELAVSDLANEKAPPPNDAPSAPQLTFDPDTTLVTDDLTPAAAARLLKRQRGNPWRKVHE
jgi:hypothetical protein